MSATSSPGAEPVDEAAIETRLEALDLADRVRLLTGADNWHTHAAPRAGLAQLLLSDGPAGVRGSAWDGRDPSANLPCPTAMAASFDAAHLAHLGELLAGEARRKGAHVLLGPTINLQRTPVGGRHFECFSEDPLLTGMLAAAYVRSVQAGGVAATPKHLVANDSETDRRTVDVRMSRRALHEVYLAPFEAAVVDAGAWTVMAAYNSLGGFTLTEHPLLVDLLKGDWGFDGVVVSDWYATTSVDASARGGLDLVMPGPGGPWAQGLLEAVEAGRVPEEAVADKVRRLLRLAARVGGLGTPADAPDAAVDGPGPAQPPGPAPDDERVRVRLREAARRGFVLLRNEDLLPLAPEALRRVAVLGPNAERGRRQGGGSVGVVSPHAISPLAGLRARLGDEVEVSHAAGARIRRSLPSLDGRLARDPVSDEPGLRVRFLGDEGEVLTEQHRDHGRLIWFDQGFDLEGVDDADVRAIEVRARVRVPDDGPWRFGVAGVGRYALDLDGERILDVGLTVPEGDMVEVLVRPNAATADRELSAGAELDLVCRHEVTGTGAILRLGLEPVVDPEDELAEAERLAAEADVAVVVVGTNEEVESEGFDRTTLALPGRQDELVRRVVAANPRTVVVVNSGAPVLLPWVDEVPATLLTWFPGQEFGDALADVLVGDAEPGGRLPMTWPASDEQILDPTPVDGRLEYHEGIHAGYRRWLRDELEPAFWFGHGLGYTTWEYEAVYVQAPNHEGTGGEARVRVRNTGTRPGREVVQAYLARTDSEVERPVRWLAGCASVLVPPGATTEAVVQLWPQALRHLDEDTSAWRIEPGDYELMIGRSVADAGLTTTITVPGR
jgi:beta-glucosidase